MRTTTALLFLAFVAPFAAQAETRVSMTTFVFAKPGETTPAQAKKLAGTPTEEYEAEVLRGDLEPDVVPANPDTHLALLSRSDREHKPIERVLVLEWRDDVDPTLFGTLVFRGDRLAWAIVPVSPSENSRKKLSQRFGEVPRVRGEEIRSTDVRWTRDVIVFPARGAGYFDRPDGTITHKMIYVPRT